MILSNKQVAELKQQLRKFIGEAVCAALVDPTVTDIKVGEDGVVWLQKHGLGEVSTGKFLPEERRRLALNVIATLLGKRINAGCSRLSGELPLTGDRVQGFVPPTAAPSFYIRRHAPDVFTFDDYLAKGILELWQVDVIRAHMRRRSNIIISGSTGSGKTTILNTAIQELSDANEHVVVIEDTREIKVMAPNVSRLQTSETTTLQQLIVDAMRVAPKRLVIGETRDKAGLELLKAWDTGHRGGLTTVHATNAGRVFDRFAQFCYEAGVPPQWELMRSTINLIVHMEMTPRGRRAVEIIELRTEEKKGEGLPEYLSQALTTLCGEGESA